MEANTQKTSQQLFFLLFGAHKVCDEEFIVFIYVETLKTWDCLFPMHFE